MVEQFAQADCMSVLFNRDKSVEIFPEPFRLQENVLIRVTYSEYINYIKTLNAESGVRLCNDLSILKKYANYDNQKLYGKFLCDALFALAKELYFGEMYRRTCTWILPSNGNINVPLSVLLEWFPQCAKYAGRFRDEMLSWGYKIPKVVSTPNLNVYKVCLILYACVISESSVQINVVYDT